MEPGTPCIHQMLESLAVLGLGHRLWLRLQILRNMETFRLSGAIGNTDRLGRWKPPFWWLTSRKTFWITIHAFLRYRRPLTELTLVVNGSSRNPLPAWSERMWMNTVGTQWWQPVPTRFSWDIEKGLCMWVQWSIILHLAYQLDCG